MTFKKLFLCQTAGLAAFVLPAISQAQTAAPIAQVAAEEPTGLPEIVVTAEKRPNVAQRTGISLSVLDSRLLAENGVKSLTDLQNVAPSVSFAKQINQTMVVIRGVSSRDPTAIGDPAVSVSIDGFNLQRASGLDAVMFDLERVEVLRGPQGTLLGRNATGGAVNIITAKPSDSFSASVSGDVGSFSTYNTDGYVNLPVNDQLQLRASFQTRYHEGYRNNAPAEDADDENSKAARLHVAFQPTPRLNALLTAEYFESRTNGPAYYSSPVLSYTAANVPPGLLVGDFILQKPPIPDNAKAFPMPPGQHVNSVGRSVRASFDYDLGFGTLTYVGGWRRLKVDRLTSHGAPFGTNRQNFAFQLLEYPESWNHELRLSAKPGEKLFWQVGGYYFKEDVPQPFNRLIDFPNSPGLYGYSVPLQTFDSKIRTQAKAVFGQLSYEILPGLRIEGGARYTEDEKSISQTGLATSPVGYLTTRCSTPGFAACTYAVNNFVRNGGWTKTTYHTALNYQFAPRNLLYGKFDTGYKAGGFNGDGTTFGPETIKAWEVGSKNRFMENRLQLNLSAFYYDYSNQQVLQTINPPSGLAVTQIVPAGKSQYKGVEVDASFQPTSNDRLDLFVGYTDAQYDDFKLSVSGLYRRIAAAEGKLDANNNWQLAGRRPPQAPVWIANVGYGHDWPVFEGKLNTRIQSHYESKSYLSPQNNGSDRQDGYTRSDILVTYKPDNGKWQLQGYVRNIENALVLTNSADASSTTFLTYRYQFTAPRTYGARLTVNW